MSFEILRIRALVHGMTLTRMGGHSVRTFILHGPKGTFQCAGLDQVARQLEAF
jgi:hypothetical protein